MAPLASVPASPSLKFPFLSAASGGDLEFADGKISKSGFLGGVATVERPALEDDVLLSSRLCLPFSRPVFYSVSSVSPFAGGAAALLFARWWWIFSSP